MLVSSFASREYTNRTPTQTYLLWRYPIKSIDGERSIPTCPYVWPDGQGDVAKFLEGEKNNGIWRAEYGGIYRVWSGMSAEM